MIKRILAFVCVLALLLSTPIVSVEAASAADTYRVGFGKVDVTPEVNSSNPQLAMGGYGDMDSRRATTIMTPQFLKAAIAGGQSKFDKSAADTIPDNANPDMYHLYASCIAITDQLNTTVLLVSVDVIGISTSQTTQMRKAITAATGVPEENITITSTHTHSAPAATSTSYTANNNWRDVMLTNGIVEAAVEALANRTEATMWEGTVTASSTATIRHYYTSTAESPMKDEAGNRYVNGSNFGSIYDNNSVTESVKPADEDMYLLMFKMEDSQKKDIVLCNYRVHPCRDSSSSSFTHDKHEGYTAISSDYIGPMRDTLEQAGYDFAYFQGSAGNVASKGGKSSYHYGVDLAAYALTGLENMTQVTTGPIQTQRVSMSADSYTPDPADIEPARNVRALYNDLLDGDPAINDAALAEIFETAEFVEKKISLSLPSLGIIRVKDTNVKVNATYENATSDGKITSTEAHNIANRLAWSYGLGSRYHANNIVSNAKNQGTKKLQLNAFTLGEDIAIVTDQNEIFDDLTQDLATYYGKRTLVFGYTNGSNGYLPNDDAFHYNATKRADGTLVYGGSYEVHVTDYAMGTGAKVAATMKTMLDDMKDSMKNRYACPCMGAHTSEQDCEKVAWQPWTSTTSLPTSGNYYLTENVTVTGSSELLGTLNLDLNGKTIEGKNGIFTISKGDHLVVTDSYAGGKLGTSGVPIVASSGSKLTVYDGTIGGTIKNNGATVNLYGAPSLYINMARNAPAMNCQNLQEGAYVYVVGSMDQCFANISRTTQKDYFSVPNECNAYYKDGALYLTSKQYHCACGGSLSESDTGHVCELVSWQAWSATDSLPTTSGNYYLVSNVYLTSEQAIEAGATVRLDMNGKTVYVGQTLDADGNRVVTENGTRALYVPNGSTLELCSSTANGTGTLEGVACAPSDRSKYGGIIYADTGSTLNIYNNLTINGNRYTSTSTSTAFKRVATAVKGGCIYSLGTLNIYGGTIVNGSVAGNGKAGGNIYSNGNFAMYGGTIHKGVGSTINLYLDTKAVATIGGTAYIYAGVSLNGSATLKLTGTPHIPGWYAQSIAGISINSNFKNPIDATGLDISALTQTAPDGNDSHFVDIKVTENTTFANVASSMQANYFVSFTEGYSTHSDADGNVSMYALNAANRYNCLCCGKLAGTANHKTCTVLTWQPWTATDSLPTEGNWYLTADVAVSAYTTVSSELNLDLNGNTVTATGNQRVFDVLDDATLRITDSGNTGTIDCSAVTFEYEYTYAELSNKANHGGVISLAKGTFELFGGTLIGPANVARGGIVYAVGTSASKTAKLNIYGGTMTGGNALFGGGIYAAYTAIKMYGGTISYCSANRGGSIYQSSSAGLTIKDGTIAYGTASAAPYFKADSDGNYTVSTTQSAIGGNIYSTSGSLYVDGGLITDGTVENDNGNGGNIAASSSSTAYIRGGVITRGKASNMGANIYVSKKLHVYGGEITNPRSSYNISLWNGAEIYVTNGKIYGGTYGIYNGSSGGKTTLKEGAYVAGSSYGIYMNNTYALNAETGLYEPNGKTHSTLVVDKSFTGTANVTWASDTFTALGVGEGREIENTTAKNYTGTGTLICDNLDAPLVGGPNGKLVVATVAIADGDGIYSYHPDFDAALEAYQLEDSSTDQKYIQLLTDLTDVAINKSIYVDLNGYSMTVASVAEGCLIYGMDSVTNQYTHYAKDGTDLCGKLTLAEGIDSSCIVKDVRVNLTKASVKGTRKYLALAADGSYTFHRYYLTLTEAGLRPSDAGIFYNATFYGDEAIAKVVTKYGVQVSTKNTFDEGFTASSNYQDSLSAFASGIAGNQGTRTVLKGILSENGVEPVLDYSNEDIYGRAYIEADGITLYCSNVISTTLRSIISSADKTYGQDGFSKDQKAALDAMYNKYSKIMEGWNILRNIGRVEIDINDLFAKDPKKDDELNILLIGNSFSFYWVEELYGLLAEGSGYAPEKINITNVYYSGCPLKNHWNWLVSGEANYNIAVTTQTGREYDKTKFENLATVITGERAKSWDYISLQQNSPAFYNGEYVGEVNYARETLEPYLGNILNYLRTYYPKSEYMWHQFWSHEVGHTSTSGTVTVNNIAERTAFYEAMVAIGGEVAQLYNMTVVPTGDAWELVRDDKLITTPHSSSNKTTQSLCTRMSASGGLWDDLYHDGDAGGGQFLNACVWYEKITGKSVLDVNWTPTYIDAKGVDFSLSTEQIALLKNAAHTAASK